MKQYLFKDIVGINNVSIKEFEKVEGKPWKVEGSMIELSKQVGDLAKRVMVYEKYYLAKRDEEKQYKTSKDNIADELSDIFFCINRIANYYNIDLEKAILDARREDQQSLGKKTDF